MFWSEASRGLVKKPVVVHSWNVTGIVKSAERWSVNAIWGWFHAGLFYLWKVKSVSDELRQGGVEVCDSALTQMFLPACWEGQELRWLLSITVLAWKYHQQAKKHFLPLSCNTSWKTKFKVVIGVKNQNLTWDLYALYPSFLFPRAMLSLLFLC